MAFQWDPVVFINLVLCIVIVILGILCSVKSGEQLPLYIAAAFGLFGLSHAASLSGLDKMLPVQLLIGVRVLAYLIIVYSLFRYLRSSIMAKETRQAWVDYYRGEAGKKEGP